MRTVKTEKEFKELCDEIRGRKHEVNPVTVEFDNDSFDDTEPYNWDIEYLEIIRVDNHEVIKRIKYD